jgi:glucose-1-phosphate cytidylyltransferase
VKVVLFCGGFGIRMGEATQRVPKPMIPIGGRPILWHIMRYYASWGHKDFILCLGYRAEAIKEFFLTYNEAMSNDFVLSNGSRDVKLLSTDIQDWTITFVDTGMTATIGERLKAVDTFIAPDELFLASYGDGLTDAPLDDMIDRLEGSGKSATFLAVRPNVTMHVVEADDRGIVRSLKDVAAADIRINGGYFVLKREVLDLVQPGEELVEEPFGRLIEREELIAYAYDGFWEPMDTLKDTQRLEGLWNSGEAPWVRTRNTVA